MHHVMFDIDGTLVESYDFDEEIYSLSVKEVLSFEIDRNWSQYKHVSDVGILNEIIDRNGLSARRNEIQCKVKDIFINEVSSYLDKNPVREVPGAIAFLDYLETLNDVTISFATGGWCETAILKLDSAGFNYSKERIASSNDHYERTQIMTLAKAKYLDHENIACTYFGDGIWDKEACEELGFNFVLVGDKTKHTQNISDFNPASKAMAYIDL